jgi:predicted RNase H-like HicB family nuclease
MAIRKDVAYYRSLPYRRTIEIEVGADEARPLFIARIEEIPFIRIHGESREEALARLDEVFGDCLQSLIDAGESIPEPQLWPGPGIRMEEAQLPLLQEQPEPQAVAPAYLTADDISPWTAAPPGARTVGV